MSAIKFYLDEDVSDVIAEMLRSSGINVTTTHDARRKATSDDDQLRYAVDLRYVIVTHNRNDYQLLCLEYFRTDRTHAGIVLAVRRPPGKIAELLKEIVESFSAEEMVNQIIYI